MKNIHIQCDDKEYRKIRRAKELSNAQTWREWLLGLADRSRRDNES